MKPVVARLYGLLVILTLLSLVAWSVTDWYQQRQQADEQGQAALRQVAGLLADRSLHPDTAGSLPLAQTFLPLSLPDGRWKTVLLYSSNGTTEYYRGPRPSVPPDQAVPHWKPQLFSEVLVSIPVFRADGGPQTIEGIYEFYGRTEVLSLLKAVGFTLVILLVLTTIVVFFETQFQRNPDTEEAEPTELPPEVSPSEDLETPDGFPVPELDIPLESEAEIDDEYWFDDNLTMEDLPPLEDFAPEIAPPEVPTATATGPSLFSPTTGLGWEDYLATRLSFELDRSASQNADLSVILLVPKEGKTDPQVWGQAVREAFLSADLDFEYGPGAAVILPGQTLEQALRAARLFIEGSDRNLPGVTIHAGVAARTGRLLSSDVLLGEAQSAIRRSLAGSVRVLGLKTDPDRYREHLASASA